MLRLTLSIDSSGVALQPGDQGWTGELAMIYDERAADGKDLGRISETLKLHYDEDHYQKLAADGITYERLVHPTAQATQVRIVVYDRGSGRVGSVAVKW
ncbi:hypothetical protein SBA3_470008 [Candidatus Sulfopaludibacter sp. SbA3]|nr:hypothetical protein SBA3_470008 [Candidatus Sulfopaludibacter sp. SbA3]